MARPLRFPQRAETLDAVRWPYVVAVDRHLVRLSARYDDILAAEVVAWLRANVRRGGWRFAKRLGITCEPVISDPCRVIASIETVFQVHLTQENDAFAFKMRWC